MDTIKKTIRKSLFGASTTSLNSDIEYGSKGEIFTDFHLLEIGKILYFYIVEHISFT